MIPAAAHTPVLVYFDTDRVTTPAEICQACSDPDAGRWVPASFCPEAKAKMDQAPRQTGKAPQ